MAIAVRGVWVMRDRDGTRVTSPAGRRDVGMGARAARGAGRAMAEAAAGTVVVMAGAEEAGEAAEEATGAAGTEGAVEDGEVAVGRRQGRERDG